MGGVSGDSPNPSPRGTRSFSHGAIVVSEAPTQQSRAPDVIVIGPEWPGRALLRASLIEEGYSVVAIDVWPIPRAYRRPGMKPRVVVVDLQGIPEPRSVLDEMRFVVRPESVLVVTALGTLPVEEVRRLGFQVISRPTSIGAIVAAVSSVLRASGAPAKGTK
jgi:hypothetical protein